MGASNPVFSRTRLQEVVDEFITFDEFVFDVETKGEWRLDPRRNEVFWIVLAGPGARTEVIPFGHPHGRRTGTGIELRTDKNGTVKRFKVPTYGPAPKQLSTEYVMSTLKPLFFSAARKIGHNVKFDIESSAKYWGELPPGPFGDTQSLAHLKNENFHKYKLGEVLERELGVKYDKSLGIQLETYSFQEAAFYTHCDGRYEWLLWQWLWPQIEELGLAGPRDLDFDLIAPLAAMEQAGIPLDVDAARKLDRELDRELVEVRRDMMEIVGRDWNPNSNPQKQKIFYDPVSEGGRGLKPTKKTKTGWSTDDDSLREHEGDELIDTYIRYGDLHKASNTYVKAYLGTAERKTRDKNRNNAPALADDGRVHPNFRMTTTVTGRLSCVAADSLIEMPRDLHEYPDGVPITEVHAGDWVYAFDWRRELALRQVIWVAQTGVRQTVVVTAENSEGHRITLRLTPDHLVRLRNGDWRPAGSLMHRWGQAKRNDGPRVMTMVRRVVDDGYIKFFPHSVARGDGTSGGGKNREHRWIVEQITGNKVSTKADVHHVDGRRANNWPTNLEALSISEHRGRRHLHPHWGTGRGNPAPDIYTGPSDYFIVSVSPGPVEPVWDMEVDQDHNFIANNFVVHNCTEPNLQNIPRPDTDLGKQLRSLFIAPPGHKLVVADYKQVEYVVMAHFSGDPVLVKFFEEGRDFHYAVASMVFGIPESQVTKVQRTTAKNTNFAVGYGAGIKKIAAMSGITVREAEHFSNAHKKMLPALYRFNKEVINVCRRRKPPHVKTLLGRKRRLYAINSRDDDARMYAERQAVNSVIQGSASDLNKVAAVRLFESLEPNWQTLLTVHDEFVIAVPDDEVDDAIPVVREAMIGEGVQELLRVPLGVDIQAVQRWSDAKE